MKGKKVRKEGSVFELIYVGLPIFVITLVGVFIIKVFFQTTLLKDVTILIASIIISMLIHIGGFGIHRFWNQLK